MESISQIPVLVPIIEWSHYAKLSGIPEGVLDGMCNKGLIPTITIGKRRCINVVKLIQKCLSQEGDSK
jgi:hypothetical protein